MGTVYRAVDTRTKKTVAVKILHPHLAADHAHLERFRREARIIALLDSDYIVKLLDFGEAEGHHYMVSEFVQGAKLNTLFRDGPADPLEALAVVAQVALALEAAEKHGIVHRDIKPDNILLTADYLIKVTDFGIARLTQMTGVTVTGVFIGTPAYAAPEQARGVVDSRSDIYALGVTLFEMLTGGLPFQSDTPIELIRLHEQEPPPLDQLKGIPGPVVEIVERCLAKQPEDRFQSAGDLAEVVLAARTSITTSVTDTWVQDATVELANRTTIPLTPPTLPLNGDGGDPPARRRGPGGLFPSGHPSRMHFALLGGFVSLVIAAFAFMAIIGGGSDSKDDSGDVRQVLESSRTPRASRMQSLTPSPARSATPTPTQTPTPVADAGNTGGGAGEDASSDSDSQTGDSEPASGGEGGGPSITDTPTPSPTPIPPPPWPPAESVRPGRWDFRMNLINDECGFDPPAGTYTLYIDMLEIGSGDGAIRDGEKFTFRYPGRNDVTFTMGWPAIAWSIEDDEPYQDGPPPDSAYRLDFTGFDSADIQLWETYVPTGPEQIPECDVYYSGNST